MDTNHAYRILAHDLILRAQDAASRGLVFGDKVPLGALVDVTEDEAREQLVEMNRMGLIQLCRADLTAAWVAKFGETMMRRSEMNHLTTQWHALVLPRS